MKCFADGEKSCKILKVKNCNGCKFFKTKEQYEEDLKKYPFDKNYASTHKEV